MSEIAQRWALITGLTFTMVGCQYGQTASFGAGGSTNEINGGSDGDGDGDADADADADGGPPIDDTAEPSSGGETPVLHNLDARFDEYPNIGWVIEIVASYTDGDDDVDGGKLFVMAEVEEQAPEEQWISIDGMEAFVDPDAGTVMSAIEVSGDDITAFLTVAIKDQNYNVSNEVTAQAQ